MSTEEDSGVIDIKTGRQMTSPNGLTPKEEFVFILGCVFWIGIVPLGILALFSYITGNWSMWGISK